MFEQNNENNHMSENENEMNEKTVNSNYSFDEMKLKNNKIEHENDNEIINYIKNLKNKDIEINTEDLLEFSK